MLRFNTFRSGRYLRSKFVEGKYLLASEATDLELEVLDLLREVVKATIGDVAIEDAWKVERLSDTQILIKPGQAYFKGLPFAMRSGKDQLVTGAVLSLGTVPVGTVAADDSTGLGKIITFNSGSVTPSNIYRLVISAREELITEVDDPFLQNVNLTESTAQKIRLNFQLNIVPESLQTESSVPYRDESSASVAVTNFPNAGGQAAPNYVNQIVATPTAAGNAELISLNLISGSEGIDGRDVELVLRNDPGIGGGNPFPNSPSSQQAFSNGKLIDSYGGVYHINAIFNDTVSTQVVIRIDKEPDQPNPQIVNTFPITVQKRAVFVTDDSNGVPQGRLHWPIATLDWDSTDGIVHQSKITDLRNVISIQEESQRLLLMRDNVKLVGGGNVSFNLSNDMLTWTESFELVNPHGPLQTIAAAFSPLVDGGSIAFEMDLENGGSIQRGSLAVTVSSGGTTATLAAVDLSQVRLGNVLEDSNGDVHVITEIDNVNDTVTAATSIATGAATIHMDSFGPGYAPLDKNSFILAVRSGEHVLVGGEEEESESEDRNAKLVSGGTWSYSSGTLTWSADAYIQVPGLQNERNTILANNISLSSDGEVAYVNINRTTGSNANLSVVVADIQDVVNSENLLIFARRVDGDVILGTGTIRLKDGQSSELDAQMSNENLTFIGATSTADDAPNYPNNNYVTDGQSLVDAIGTLDDELATVAGSVASISWKDPVANFAALPALGNTDGDVRLVLDTRIAYHWDAGDMEWKPLTGTGGGVKVIGGGDVSWEAPGGSAATIYQHLTGGDQSGGSIQSATHVVGASFQATVTALANKVTAGLVRVGSPVFDIVCDIRSIGGTILDTSINVIPAASVSASPGSTYEFTFAGVTLNSGTSYIISYRPTNITLVDGTNRITGDLNTTDAVAGHNWLVSTDSGGSFGFSTGREQVLTVEEVIVGGVTFTDPLQLEMKGLDYSDNNIPITESPIMLNNDLDVAYVIPNVTPGGPDLSIVVDTLANVPVNAIIIARREGTDAILGSSSTRLLDGQSTRLYSQMSDQNLAYIGATDTVDEDPSYSSDIRGTAGQNLTARTGALTDALGDQQEDRSAYLRSDLPVTWTGTQLIFSSDIVLEVVNTKSGTVTQHTILASASPLSLSNGQSAWIAINRLSASENVTLQTGAVPAQSQANKDVFIVARRQDASSVGYLHLPLHKQVLEPGQTVRLGASGAGTGGANETLETLKNRFLDSPFELLTPNIFSVNEDNLVDGSSTGEYSLVDKSFNLDTIGETMVSSQMLDPDEFLSDPASLGHAELMVFWKEGFVDPIATYEVSRNGGNAWQAVDMERVGTTELFRGIHSFSTESNQTVLSEAAVSGQDTLNATTIQELAQKIVLTDAAEIRSIELLMNKAAAAVGNIFVQIRTDNAGEPSDTVLTESNAISIASLSTGNITVTANFTTVLAAGTYHIVLRTDAAYKAGTMDLSWRRGTGAEGRSYNGTVWATTGFDYGFNALGIELDLRVRITSATTDVKLTGYGIFYKKSVGNLVTGLREIEVFKFSGDLNTTDFAVSNFTVNPEQLKVYDVNTGKVYRYGIFAVDGNTVKFDSGQFLSPGETITLMFDQTSGGAFDTSDVNGLLLASNHLGSSDPNIDKSQNGRGIFLRRPDGTLREIAIDDSDNIVVYSV